MLNKGNKMKIIFPLFIIFILFFHLGCSQITHLPKQVNVTCFDFTKYNNEGFLFTTESYLGDYESIGLLNVEILPELRRISGVYPSPGQFYTPDIIWEYVPVNPKEILNTLYSKATRMGADAVIKLTFQKTDLAYKNITAPGYRASGFAIKRRGAFK